MRAFTLFSTTVEYLFLNWNVVDKFYSFYKVLVLVLFYHFFGKHLREGTDKKDIFVTETSTDTIPIFDTVLYNKYILQASS